jgi:hypothetical protein
MQQRTALNLQHSTDEAELFSQSRAEFVRDLVRRQSRNPDSGGSDDALLPDDSSQVTISTPKIINFPEYRPLEARPTDSFYALEEWEGRIQEMVPGHIRGLVYNTRGTDRSYSQDVDLPVDLISPEDLPYLSVGSVFRLLIGYNQRLGGPRTRSTLVYLRRSSAPDEEDLLLGNQIEQFFSDAEFGEPAAASKPD